MERGGAIEDEREVEPLDVRAGRPVEQRDEVGLLGEPEPVTARRDEGGVIDHDRRAHTILAVRHHAPLDQEVEPA